MPPYIAAAVLVTVIAVVFWVFEVLWRQRLNPGDGRTAVAASTTLAAWAVALAVLGSRGLFLSAETQRVPPIGIALLLALVVWGASLAMFPSLWRILSRAQPSLIRLHMWRYLGGFVFLVLMVQGRLPALFAVPAALGDVAIAATAPWIARKLTRNERRTAVLWNLFGVLDLVVAITLGITTNPGPVRVFQTSPTSEILTAFPVMMVPTFLVPLALTVHFVSLRLLLGRKRAPSETGHDVGHPARP